MKYSFALAVVLAMTMFVDAQVPFLGVCPVVKPVKKLNLDNYMGYWFEHSRYPFVTEAGNRCIYTHYTHVGNGEISLKASFINIATGARINFNGEATDKSGGKFNLRFNPLQNPNVANMLVLGTDYKNWAVVYTCENIFGVSNVQVLYILSRQRELPAKSLAEAKRVISQNGLDASLLVETPQTGCTNTELA